MNKTSKISTDLHRVGGGFSVRFSLDGNHLSCEWTPHLPTKREFNRVVDRYRSARQVFLIEHAKRIDGTVLCVEV